MRASELPHITADILTRLRARSPRVHCITNAVAQAFTANVLLAAGAIPSMTLSADEIGAFVARADALLVNLGTFDAERREAAATALEVASEEGVPWVLDPVFIDRSEPRAAYAKSLVAQKPRAIRLNRAEFVALSGVEPDDEALTRYALDTLAVVALTGTVDRITDGAQCVAIENGHPLMARVTAMGCAASALNAAFLAVESDPFVATAAALLCFGVAGGIAGERATGPGSFAGRDPRCALCARSRHADRKGEGDMTSMCGSTRSSIRSARTAARSPSCAHGGRGRRDADPAARQARRDAAHDRAGARHQGGARRYRRAAGGQRSRRRGAGRRGRRRACRAGRHAGRGCAAAARTQGDHRAVDQDAWRWRTRRRSISSTMSASAASMRRPRRTIRIRRSASPACATSSRRSARAGATCRSAASPGSMPAMRRR